MKKISIIIPCYNVAKYLPKCLDSIINQTYKNLEIICVNDGSPDNCLEILENYKMKDNRIVIISQKNQGLSSARNAGIKCAKGDFIMFVDSDDWIEIDCCEKAINEALENNADLVIWNYIRQYPNNPMPRLILGKEKLILEGNDCKTKIYRRIFGLYNDELSSPETVDSLVTVWGKLYRISYIKENDVQFVDTNLIGNEDALFNIFALKDINKAVYIPDCLYNYRKNNESSFTSNYRPNLYSQWQCLFDLMSKNIVDNSLDNTYFEALQNRICLSIIGLGLNIVGAGKEIKKVKEIKKIISSSIYRKAYNNLMFKYFPIHWKVFFTFAKYNWAFGVYLMLFAIKMLIGK